MLSQIKRYKAQLSVTIHATKPQKFAMQPRSSLDSGFGNPNVLVAVERLNTRFPWSKAFDRAIAQETPIEWNLRLKLLAAYDMTGVSTSTYPESSKVVAEIILPLRQLQYAIAHRLYSLKYDGRSHCPWVNNLFPEVAKLDSIRVLGALRANESNGLDWMWKRLLELDRQKPLDHNPSAEVQVMIQTASQIDVPFALHILQKSPENHPSSRATVLATYVLSRMFGRYAKDLLTYEIWKSQRGDVPGVGMAMHSWYQQR